MARDGFGWDGGNESLIAVGVFAPAPGPYAHSARADTRNAHFWLAIARLREAAVDLGAHDVAVGGGVVETTQQRARQQVTGVLELGDLLVEGGQPAAGDGLPFRRSAGVKDAVDVVEGETGILEHADEYQPSERLGPVSALSRSSSVGRQQPAPLVVANRRGGYFRLLGYLADHHQFGHKAT